MFLLLVINFISFFQLFPINQQSVKIRAVDTAEFHLAPDRHPAAVARAAGHLPRASKHRLASGEDHAKCGSEIMNRDELLEKLSKDKLVLDWKKRLQTRAAVLVTIEEVLDMGLPRAYSPELYKEKCDLIYQHVYDSYYGQGRSVYSAVNA